MKVVFFNGNAPSWEERPGNIPHALTFFPTLIPASFTYVAMMRRLGRMVMTVGRDYLLKQPSGPSAPKLFLDTRIIPGAVNLAGGFEVALDRIAKRTGLRPAMIFTGGIAAACFVIFGLRRPRDRATAAHRDRAMPALID
ncbi:hypothetical protein U1701_09265 [Sphingomonas sp. PB2P19]|uniref:hypothetical protein n=1 Tax=Sphingomonas rhamnosi TaxID=3096156 RepID=UPI002FC6DE88